MNRIPDKESFERFNLFAPRLTLCLVGLLSFVVAVQVQAQAPAGSEVSYEKQIAPLFQEYCGGCHNESDREGGFSVATYSSLMKGAKKGKVIGDSSKNESKLLQLISGQLKPQMPPEDEPQLSADQVKLVTRWIAEGAKGSDRLLPLRERLKSRSTDRLTVHGLSAKRPITSIAILPSNWLAVGSSGSVGLRSMSHSNEEDQRTNQEVVGKVSQIRLSRDGTKLIAASGIAGLGGQISLLDPVTLKQIKQIECSLDTLYAAVPSPKGDLIAAGGYDRSIQLFDASTGERIRSLEGHNAAIYDLDFDSSGSLLASASGDETVKIWSVATGERLDTLGQGEGEQYSVRFSPDGKWIAAAGADRRIRLWKVVSRESAAINPMVESVFAHEGSVLAISFSADGQFMISAGEDKKIKLWSSPDMQPLGEIGAISDTPTAIAIDDQGSTVYVASMDGRIAPIAIPSRATKKKNDQYLTRPIDLVADPRRTVALNEIDEAEPNNHWEKAQSIALPAKIRGAIAPQPSASNTASQSENSQELRNQTVDEDWFAFDAKEGEAWVIDVSAARNKSPLDSRIEVCDSNGKPLLRTRLQAVRESYFTFRGKSSDVVDDFRLHRWEDMELNQWLYAGGEVVKLWLYPRGPDSGFKVYPGFGNRFTYFDTTATSHALGENVWIVRELAANEAPIPNGLPLFPIYFENDDEGQRRFGKDSKLYFTAPRTDRYLLRIRDARGESGEKYRYELSVVPPRPDFSVVCNVGELAIVPGSGREFEVTATRNDQFEGPISIRLDGLPEGLVATQPLTIEAGQHKALGTIVWTKEAPESTSAEFDIQVIAEALLPEGKVERAAPKPIHVKRATGDRVSFQVVPQNSSESASSNLAITLRAGEMVSARVIAERGKFAGDIGFGTDDSGRNLPHGVIVGNIGLSGLLIPAGKTEQELVLVAAPWIEPQERLFHLRANIEGNPTTVPILLRITK